MLLIECSNMKKYFGDRLILDIEDLKIYSEDRIGIIGVNGAGKTTLINILTQKLEADEGWIKLHGRYAYISQLEAPDNTSISSEMASKFGIPSAWHENLSGGEKTRFKLAQSLDNNSIMLFADEPTSNVDMEGIELLEQSFGEYNGALILISHDRSFLDKLCNKILEIENGRIKIYHGNYSGYQAKKIQEKERVEFEYQQYVKEKKQLEEIISDTKEKVRRIKKAPKRMGNSEARLHKMGDQKAKATLDRAVKNIAARIEHLEVKEKPKKAERIQLDIADSNRLYSKIVLEGRKISKVFSNKTIFRDVDFTIYNGTKTALIGPNGCGKSTLIKMIMEQDNAVKIAQGARIGYFSQDMYILKENMTIIENVMETSGSAENFARTLLARLLFKREDIYKKVNMLSGGERVKVSLAKILLQDINFLILDEPTNYMDITSLEAIEEALKDYDRTLLFVSHDRRFVDSVADHIMTIEDYKINIFQGNYQEYLSRRNKPLDNQKQEIEKRVFVLQNRLSEIVGKLSLPSKNDDIIALDKEYYGVLEELKKLKENL